MTSPFAFTAPRPEPVSSDIVEANASRSFGGFPSFSFGEIPPVAQPATRNRAPSAVSKEMQTYAEPFKNFTPMEPSHHIVFGPTNHTDAKVNDATHKLAGKVARHLRKSTGGVVRMIQRTVVHPEDMNKPAHEQRKFLVGWRNEDAELSA